MKIEEGTQGAEFPLVDPFRLSAYRCRSLAQTRMASSLTSSCTSATSCPHPHHHLCDDSFQRQRTDLTRDPRRIAGKAQVPMDAGSHYDYLRIKAEVLPDRTRQVEYISADGKQRPKKVIRDWIQVRELGSGANGVVWMERADDGAVRAVKHLQKSQRVTNYLQELVTMAKLSKVIILLMSDTDSTT